MQRLKLPDGTYLNPGEVKRLQVKKHFWGKKYYVQVRLDNGSSIDFGSDLSEIEAREIRQQYEHQIEILAADISAYKKGRAAGLSRGEKIGYAKGYRAGYNDGAVNASTEGNYRAYRDGIEEVLGQLRAKQYEFNDEMRYQANLIEPRRQSLIAMDSLIEGVIEIFAAQQPPTDADRE